MSGFIERPHCSLSYHLAAHEPFMKGMYHDPHLMYGDGFVDVIKSIGRTVLPIAKSLLPDILSTGSKFIGEKFKEQEKSNIEKAKQRSDLEKITHFESLVDPAEQEEYLQSGILSKDDLLNIYKNEKDYTKRLMLLKAIKKAR